VGGRKSKGEDYSWAPDPVTGDLLRFACAGLHVPTINRHSLRRVADELHKLANRLQELSLVHPGETMKLSDVLSTARGEVMRTERKLLEIKKADIVENKRRNVIPFGVERKVG
jgi:hypothetical protein